MAMDGEPPFPAGSRRALVALLVVGAVVLAAAAFGVRAVLGAAGGHDRQPSEAAGVAAAGTTVAGQAIGVSVAGGRSGGPAATGAGTSGGAGGGTGGATSKRRLWPGLHRDRLHHAEQRPDPLRDPRRPR
jgi:hypothetical protein